MPKVRKEKKRHLDNPATTTTATTEPETRKEKKHLKKSKHSNLALSSPFRTMTVKLHVHLPPCFAGENTSQGVGEQLNSFLMRYTSKVDGVVLAHSNVKHLEAAGRVFQDSPYCHFWITARLLVWRPERLSRLVGTVTVQSQSHIGLLLNGTFNASISAKQIPKDVYEWRAEDEEDETIEAEAEAEEGDAEVVRKEDGRRQGEWIVRETGAAVNSATLGCLQFVVLDLIKANDMLTVEGSLIGVSPPVRDSTTPPQPAVLK